MSPSSRRAWIEMPTLRGRRPATTSPSSRRAWIEISNPGSGAAWYYVALLAEGVDRNQTSSGIQRSRRCRPPRGGRG